MTFQIVTRRTFRHAHALKLYDGSMEPVHGHNWRVHVKVSADRLDSMGVVMDFHELERLLDGIIGPLHNRHLNETAPFKTRNPSAENVAAYIGEKLELPASARLTWVEVFETDENSAVYLP